MMKKDGVSSGEDSYTCQVGGHPIILRCKASAGTPQPAYSRSSHQEEDAAKASLCHLQQCVCSSPSPHHRTVPRYNFDWRLAVFLTR
jgi:hypothetical protein